ncbi:MAG: FtsX-like permease family protein [Longimicrobiales bacterium]
MDPGFDAEGLLAVSLPIVPPGYDRPEAYSDLVDRVRAATEGTAAPARVAATSSLPLERGLNFPVAIEGRPDAFEGAVEWRAVGPGYFELLDIEVLAGRVPDGSHRTDSPPVVVVSRGFADHYFPDEPALGQRIEIGRWRGEYLHPSLDRPAAEIVAVVADVRDRSPKQAPRRTIYVPFSQVPLALTATPVFLVEGDPGSVTTVRSALENADARLPTPEVRPMDDVVARSIALERFNALLLAALAASALLLTAVGVYGVIACTVNQRRREMGIRVALGAARTRVVGMIIREGMTPVLLGLVLGGVASLWLSRLVASLVWGIAPNDPRVLGTGALVLVVAALLASWIPARRATRLDPARTLGVE